MFGRRAAREQVRRLIARNRMEKAIHWLERSLRDEEDRHALALITARWNHLRRELMTGQIDREAADVERARIRQGLLDLSQHLPAFYDPRKMLPLALLAATLLSLTGYGVWQWTHAGPVLEQPATTLPLDGPATGTIVTIDSQPPSDLLTAREDSPPLSPQVQKKPKPSSFSLRGRVKYLGRPAQNVVIYGPDGVRTKSGADGHFTLVLKTRPAYPFTLLATRSGQEVKARINGPPDLLTLAFPQYVRGKVRKEGRPAGGVEISTQWGDRTVSRADGTFELALDPERQYPEKFYITCRQESAVEKVVRAGQENVIIDL